MSEGSTNRSETIAALAAALAKAQGAIEGASKDKVNPHFKSSYADLASVWAACREPLSANDLSVVQTVAAQGPSVSVVTMLMHRSGEWMSGELVMTAGQNTPQGIGSCITYARRYALAAMVGVAPEDDDGNAASQGQPNGFRSVPQPQEQAAKTTVGPVPAGYDDWWTDMQALADEGWARLSAAFNAAKPEHRNHLTKHQTDAWEALKAKAAKVKAA